MAGKRILLARADIGAPELPRTLTRAGAHVEDVAFYRTVCPSELPPAAIEAIRGRSIDWATFTSSSGVTNFLDLLAAAGIDAAAALADVRIAAIGPVAAGTLRDRGFAADAVADPHTLEALVAALVAGEQQ